MLQRLFWVAVTMLATGWPAHAQTPTAIQPGRWAHEYTDRKPDPAVRFGTLPSGLRYAIQHNETPKDGVAMRMRIGSGSTVERDEEQGLAHFLEHMAFRGSTHVADGDVVRMLERHGLKFGPDTNAFTSHEQTVYLFNFPKADTAALDTGFTLFREIAERLTLDAAAVEAEKGVVLSEERTRDTPAFRASKAELGNLLSGTRAVGRWPIGVVETIRAATPERLRRYYQAHYQPDNTTLIVVGNVDVDAVERDIRGRFSDWVGQPSEKTPQSGQAKPAQPAVEFVDPGAPTRITLAWVGPLDVHADTQARQRQQVALHLGLFALNNRLSDRGLNAGAPYVGAAAGANPAALNAASVTQVGLVAQPGKWREGLDAALEEVRRVLQEGLQPDELTRAKPILRTSLQTRAERAPTRTSADIASTLLGAVSNDRVYTSPAQDLADGVALIDAIDATEAVAALRQAFAARGPAVFRSVQDGAVGADALAQQLVASLARPLATKAELTQVDWPYSDFGERSAVRSRTEDAALGTTLVEFVNGTRLLVKPTPWRKGSIDVRVLMGEGQAGLDPALAHAQWALGFTQLGGLGRMSIGEFSRWQRSMGVVLGVSFQLGNHNAIFAGSTRPNDLLIQMRALAAFSRDPGLRAEMGEKMLGVAPTLAGQLDANPSTVFSREFGRLYVSGDRRFMHSPTAQDIAATRPDDLHTILRANTGLAADVIMVGDVEVDAAIDAVQFTFGAGPALRRAANIPVDLHMTPGRAEPYVVTHTGRADQAQMGRYWHLPGFLVNAPLARTARVAAAILRSRLNDTVREKMGLTYSPQAFSYASADHPDLGYFGVSIETPPEQFDAFTTALDAQLQALADAPVSADELQRARLPLVETARKDEETNTYWIGALPSLLQEPRLRPTLLDRIQALEAVTVEDVQTFIRTHVQGKLPLTVIARAR